MSKAEVHMSKTMNMKYLCACEDGYDEYVSKHIHNVSVECRQLGFLLAIRSGNGHIVDTHQTLVAQDCAFSILAAKYALMQNDRELATRCAARERGRERYVLEQAASMGKRKRPDEGDPGPGKKRRKLLSRKKALLDETKARMHSHMASRWRESRLTYDEKLDSSMKAKNTYDNANMRNYQMTRGFENYLKKLREYRRWKKLLRSIEKDRKLLTEDEQRKRLLFLKDERRKELEGFHTGHMSPLSRQLEQEIHLLNIRLNNPDRDRRIRGLSIVRAPKKPATVSIDYDFD